MRASLKGEPANLINALETTDLNYTVAWDMLIKRYDNKRRIVQTHIQNILNLSQVNKNSQVTLRQFISTIETNMQCLSSLKEPVDSWNLSLKLF